MRVEFEGFTESFQETLHVSSLFLNLLLFERMLTSPGIDQQTHRDSEEPYTKDLTRHPKCKSC